MTETDPTPVTTPPAPPVAPPPSPVMPEPTTDPASPPVAPDPNAPEEAEELEDDVEGERYDGGDIPRTGSDVDPEG